MNAIDLFATAVLIAALDAPRFEAREAASAGLANLGERALPALILTQTDNPEQRRRIERLIEAHRPAMVDHLFALHPGLYIEALPLDYPTRFEFADFCAAGAAWPAASCCPEDTGEDDPHELFSQRMVHAAIVHLVYSGKSYEHVRALLDAMADRQARHCNGMYWDWDD